MSKHIEAETITLKSPCGKHKLTLAATATGVGIWLEGADGRMIAINSADHQPTAIEFYSLYEGHGVAMPPLAICLDKKGRPSVQTVDAKGETAHHDLFSLLGVSPKETP